ncbi:MAG TPA: acylneuraminate cytidylyltransferase family protein, partial [Phycisphaeraceae bacterium]|nr:acylneuraminate cytidylyltransferase family protein [Phycisphaeraceae bacterium]
MNQDVLCVIIGRKGSKGAPGKNSAAIAGKPCVTWSIEHARSCHTVTRLLVSTDCPRVTAAAEQMGAEVVKRPPDLAGDNATVDAAVRHAVRTTRDDAPVVVILYANVPVRPAGLVDRAVN